MVFILFIWIVFGAVIAVGGAITDNICERWDAEDERKRLAKRK